MKTKTIKIGRRKRKTKTKPSLKNAEQKILPSECLTGTLKPFEETLVLTTKEKLQKTLLNEMKEALKPSLDSGITPQNDFYSFINDKWIKSYKIPDYQKYIVQHDDFRIVQDKVYRELMGIIHDYLKAHKTPKDAHKPGTLSHSMRNFFISQHKDCTPAQSLSAALEYMKKLDETKCPWEFMGYICRNEIISWGCPFTWSSNPDDKMPDIFRSCVDAPQMTLIDMDVYFEDLPGTNEEIAYRKNYLD